MKTIICLFYWFFSTYFESCQKHFGLKSIFAFSKIQKGLVEEQNDITFWKKFVDENVECLSSRD